MSEGPASKSAYESGSSSRRSFWREDARRSFGARFGGAADWAKDRRWPILAAVAIVALSGAGVVANGGGEGVDRADALEKTVVEREKRVAALDEERRRREDQLAELQKKINAKQSEIADAEERSTDLEKRRSALQAEVAELVGPVAPGATERVPDGDAASAHAADTPPDEMADAEPAPTPTAAVSGAQTDEPVAAARPARTRVASRDDDRDERRSRAVVDDVAPAADEAAQSVRSAGPVRVFIHVRSADPVARERAAAVAAELRRRGVNVAEIRGVRLPVRQDTVRFFYDEDRGAVPELQDAVRSAWPHAGEPRAKDLRSYGAPPRRGTIELWLS